MISGSSIWRIFREYMPRKQWISTEEMNRMVEVHGKLGEDDWQPQTSHSKTPRWKVDVRRVLANRIRKGRIQSRPRAS